MKTLELDIDQFSTPPKMQEYFRRNKPEEGDRLHIKSSSSREELFSLIALVVAIVLGIILKGRSSKKFGEEKINEVFSKTSVEELEKLMEEEYGIQLSLETKEGAEDDFRTDWYQLSARGLSNAWEEDEPDISDIPVQEPNPDYKPYKWKKDK